VPIFNRWLPEPLVLVGVWQSTLELMTDTAVVDAVGFAMETTTAPVKAAFHSRRRKAVLCSLAR